MTPVELRAGVSLSALFGLPCCGCSSSCRCSQCMGRVTPAATTCWMLYLPVILASFAAMLPPIHYADWRNRAKPVLVGAVAVLAAVATGLALAGRSVPLLAALLFAFFAAFNVLEAMLLALVSRLAPARARGTAIGVYNTAQTLGLFFGGPAGGWIASRHGSGAVFGACAGLTALWLATAAGMQPPKRMA